MLEGLLNLFGKRSVTVGLDEESTRRLKVALKEYESDFEQGLRCALQVYEYLDQRKGHMDVVYVSVNPPYRREIIPPTDFGEKLYVLRRGNNSRISIKFGREFHQRLRGLCGEGITPEDAIRCALGAYTVFLEKTNEGYFVNGCWTDDNVETIGKGREFSLLDFEEGDFLEGA